MKRLYLLRHAKADQPERKLLDDHARPLHKRGLEEAPLIGNYLKETKADFTRVLCSDALRTRQTATLALEALGRKVPIDYTRKLYHASVDQMLDMLEELEDDAPAVLVVGHNPGLHQLSIHLAEDGKRSLMRELAENFPPASLATFELDIAAWADVKRATSTLIDFTTPKKLQED